MPRLGNWKAEQAKQRGARMFVESSLVQSRVIAESRLIDVVISIETPN